MTSLEPSSTRPYLIRAIHEWCTDNGFTPYLAVSVDATVDVPREYVKDGEIVLNVSYDATGSLQLGNDLITFKARSAAAARHHGAGGARRCHLCARKQPGHGISAAHGKSG